MPRKSIQWQGYEFRYQHKRSDWYWVVGIIAIAGAAAAVIFGNILFAGVIVVGAFSFILLASQRPSIKTFELNERGLLIDEGFFPYQHLESFWVIERENGEAKLIITSRKILMPHIDIPLDEVSPIEVREFLVKKLKEIEHEESLSHRLLEMLGF